VARKDPRDPKATTDNPEPLALLAHQEVRYALSNFINIGILYWLRVIEADSGFLLDTYVFFSPLMRVNQAKIMPISSGEVEKEKKMNECGTFNCLYF
jgi:hypothetical protein